MFSFNETIIGRDLMNDNAKAVKDNDHTVVDVLVIWPPMSDAWKGRVEIEQPDSTGSPYQLLQLIVHVRHVHHVVIVADIPRGVDESNHSRGVICVNEKHMDETP